MNNSLTKDDSNQMKTVSHTPAKNCIRWLAQSVYRSKILLSGIFILIGGCGSNLLATAPFDVIPENTPTAFGFNGGTYSTAATSSMTVTTYDESRSNANGTIFNTTTIPGWEVTINSPPPLGYNVKLVAGTQVAIQKGDLIVATFYYRRKDSASGAEANFSCDFQESTSPYLQSFNLPLRGRAYPANTAPVTGGPATSDTIWRKVSIPFTSAENYAVGAAQFNFYMGGVGLQTLDIAFVSLVDYGQTSIFGDTNSIDSTSHFTDVVGSPASGLITHNVAITNLPFYSTATQIQTTVAPAQTWPGPPVAWDVRLDTRLQVPTHQGDTIVAMFWMRATSLPAGVPYAVGGIVATGCEGSGSLMTDGNWRQWIIPLKVETAELAGNTDFYFDFGFQLQTVQVAGLQVLNLGQQLGGYHVKCPLTTQLFDYPGRSLNDSWRTTAAANIVAYRQGLFTVNVKDGNGTALTGVNVTANMTAPQFGFGVQTSTSSLVQVPNGPPPPDTNFISNILPLFSHAEIGSYKWGGWEVAGTPALNSAALQVLRSKGIFDVRAHNLIWPADSLCPSDVTNIVTASAMTARITGHINGTMNTNYPPEVSDPTVRSFFNDWDAVNETYDHNDEMQVVNGLPRHTGGETQPPGSASTTQATNDATAIAGWLATIRATDPYPHLFINDWGIETNVNHIDTSHEDYDANLFTNLENANANIDGIGFESHFYDAFTPPLLLKKMFDRFATGLAPGHSLIENVTEFEATQGGNAVLNSNFHPDIDLYTDYMNDYMTEIFSEPNFDFMDQWLISNLYDITTVGGVKQWTLLPQGEAWMNLVRNQWWTRNKIAASNGSGVASLSGCYLGRYSLSASNGSITKQYFADLPTTAGATVNLQLSGSTGTTHVWTYEAERRSNALEPPFVVASDTNASGGKYVVAPAGGTNNITPSLPEMRIDTEATGNVTIWLHVLTPSTPLPMGNQDSFWGNIDGTGAIPLANWSYIALSDSNQWHWFKWETTTLSAGTTHTLNFCHRECAAELDEVLITDDPNFTPQ